MRRLAAVMLAVAAGCGPLDVTEEVGVRRSAIVDGRPSYTDPEVFYIGIRYPTGAYLCSGTLIAPHTILTAAHCVEPENNVLPTLRVRNGVLASGSPAWSVVDGAQSITHPDYVDFSQGSDVALIQLVREPFAPIKPYATEPADTRLPKFSLVRAVGFGITQSNQPASSGLKRTAVIRISEAKEGVLLVPEGTSSTCGGDSGGPSFFSYDGVEKVVGITSYGPAASCVSGAFAGLTRVDFYQDFIRATVADYESTGCTDPTKLGGCLGVECRRQDAACSCGEDGTCNASCAGTRSPDPDCAHSCGADLVCSRAACATPDPDCQAVGLPCGREGHCAGRTCITSPQHPQAYCSRTCSGDPDCPTGFTCTGGTCQYTVLPEAAFEEPCTPGGTYCKDSPQQVCASTPSDPTTRCREECYEDRGCRDGYVCSVEYSEQKPGVCLKKVTLKRLANVELEATGCAAIDAHTPLVALMLLLAARRRKLSS